MALFVRNPTKEWSELATPEAQADPHYDKLALKALIERKRQNDVVRRREFDHLRKLRFRDAAVGNAVTRPSIFQSSLPTDADGRAVTLKKIDEIEAQMSRQWWKGKGDTPEARSAASAGSTPRESAGAAPIQIPVSRSEPGVAASLLADTSLPHGATSFNDYASTEMAEDAIPASFELPSRPMAQAVTERTDTTGFNFSTSKLFALDVTDIGTDADLEEAAIRFANGDDAGAESGLILALARGHTDAATLAHWADALVGLYAATQQRVKFDAAVVDYAHLWGDRVPAWVGDSAKGHGQTDAGDSAHRSHSAGAGETGMAKAMWECPALLQLTGMESLRVALASHRMPWTLAWGGLERIDAEVMPLLAGFFSSLCNEPVSVRFSHADHLMGALRTLTPSGDRSVDPLWWGVRLNALRAMNLLDEFELVALDYCVTYEVSPPGWEVAKCDYGAWFAPMDLPMSNDFKTTILMEADTTPPLDQELSGSLAGDVMVQLADLDKGADAMRRITVNCRALVRVDFTAAGSILNWAVQRQAAGYTLQFVHLHPLVAAFFKVIGIHQHVRLTLREV